MDLSPNTCVTFYTNEGSTEEQTMVNLDFFRWLHDEYGMVLDIYVISAGAIDKAGRYGKMDSDAFRRQFPNGFGPIDEKAKTMGTRLGTWGGPDGFVDTPEEEQARIDMLVGLCRDYEFIETESSVQSGNSGRFHCPVWARREGLARSESDQRD